MHGGLKILGRPELDVDTDVIREATHEQVGLLEWRELRRMAHQGVETLLVLLDGAVPREPCKLREAVAADGWTEALVGEFLEAFPRRHALVLLEGIVPGLRHLGHVVRGEPNPIRGQCTLSSEELLTTMEPVQGIVGAVVGWEVDLAEAGDA